jgi:hypothetical protein
MRDRKPRGGVNHACGKTRLIGGAACRRAEQRMRAERARRATESTR